MTPAAIAEIEALIEKATPGPWEAGHPLDPNCYSVRQPIIECWIPQDKNDAKLITALRNAAPALLEAAEQNERSKEMLLALDKQLREILFQVAALRENIAKELKP